MKCTKMLDWLVMAAALSFTACSSEDDLAQEQTQQPTQTTTKIHVSAGAGIDDSTTRSTVDHSNGVRTLQFTTGDRLYVWGSYGNMEEEPSGQKYYPYIIAGYLDLDSDSFDPSNPTNATFTGDLTVYEWTYEVGDDQEWDDDLEDYVEVPYYVETPGYYSPALNSPNISTNDPLADFEDVNATLLHKDAVEDEDYGIIEDDHQVYYRHNCATTVEELMTTQLEVSGDYDPSTKSFALTKNANQPILNCTISGLEDGVSYKVDYIYGKTAAMSDYSMMLYSSLTATGGSLSFAFFAKTANYFHGIRLTNTADANDTYTVSIGQKAFGSKVYNLSRIWDGYSMQKRIVDLSKLSGNYNVQDGDILTGKTEYGLQIEDGATVTLSDVTINNNSIICNGDATITLLGDNNCDYSNSNVIYINAGTLTIQGSGRLKANGGDGAAGIGGGSSSANVVIKGGTIEAWGGEGAAGIGSNIGASFGTITITGGNVTAWGGDYGAGIGSGYHASCGNITITGGMVTVTGGNNAAGIGSGTDGGSCGDITIGGSAVIGATSGGDLAECIGKGMGGDCGLITVDPNMIDVGEGYGFRTIEPMH